MGILYIKNWVNQWIYSNEVVTVTNEVVFIDRGVVRPWTFNAFKDIIILLAAGCGCGEHFYYGEWIVFLVWTVLNGSVSSYNTITPEWNNEWKQPRRPETSLFNVWIGLPAIVKLYSTVLWRGSGLTSFPN